MASGDTIEITDRDAFPGKVTAIRDASSALRALGGELARIIESAGKEAASFTSTGDPAPVYSDILAGLRTWHDAALAAISALCDSADNCATALDASFSKITGTDTDHAKQIQTV